MHASHLGCAAACEGQPLLQFQAWQPVVHDNLPPGTMLVQLEGVQTLVCMVIADYKVEQQVLFCADRQQGP